MNKGKAFPVQMYLKHFEKNKWTYDMHMISHAAYPRDSASMRPKDFLVIKYILVSEQYCWGGFQGKMMRNAIRILPDW